ncbi:MAG: translation initiation factor IF-3 [Candidatus Brachytrichaceae bacterium NZ_4S206]
MSPQQTFRINNQIRVPQVRVIMPDGTNKGILDTRDALELARNMRMDLIEVAPNADPPVCRIIDYGRFIYERDKKERAAKKSQKTIEVKGVQLRPKTTEHHLAFKIRAARRFLEAGNKVKLNLRFRGREVAHQHVALKLIDRFVQELSDIGVVEVAPNLEGKALVAVIAPTPATLAAAHLKSTQQRIEAERAADRAAGYNEEEEEIEEVEDVEDVESEEEALTEHAPELVSAASAKALTKEQEAELRRRQNREKLAQKRANEQFGLP